MYTRHLVLCSLCFYDFCGYVAGELHVFCIFSISFCLSRNLIKDPIKQPVKQNEYQFQLNIKATEI